VLLSPLWPASRRVHLDSPFNRRNSALNIHIDKLLFKRNKQTIIINFGYYTLVNQHIHRKIIDEWNNIYITEIEIEYREIVLETMSNWYTRNIMLLSKMLLSHPFIKNTLFLKKSYLAIVLFLI